MNKFRRFFKIKRWEELKVFTSSYETIFKHPYTQAVIPGTDRVETFTCIVEHCKEFNLYRIKMYGYIPNNPKGSSTYTEAVAFIQKLKEK